MKTILKIKIVLVLGLLNFEIFAQDYIPLIKENAYWECNFSNPYQYTTKTFYFSGQQTINDTIYYKAFYHIMNNQTNEIDTTFFGLFREENKRGYLRAGNTELLYFNFDLHVNDVLSYNYKVESVDSIYLLQSYRKRWCVSYFDSELNDYYKTFIVEGIGSSSGFEHFFDPQCYPSQFTCNRLLNYVENNDSISNSILTNTEKLSIKSEEIAIFPNPINDISQINFPSNQIQSIKVYDLLGSCVKEIRNSNLILKNSFNTSGLFFIKLTLKSGKIFEFKVFVEK